MKHEFRKVFFVILDLKVFYDWEELELLTGIRDFTTLFSVLRHESSKWIESSIESDLGMQFAIRSLELNFHDFAFFKHSS